MKTSTLRLALGLLAALAMSAAPAMAAGILYTTDESTPRPYTWDMSLGPVPVYTDGGGAFTYDVDGVTPFITIQRANEITAFAYGQWNAVPTSTFQANVAGTIESMTGIADVTDLNANQFYGVENGYGIWVIYDTDGAILENVFGVPKTAILGIGLPEWADANGHITEATVLINGWNVAATDTTGEDVAGVFTHEFGHTINLGHSQVNGQLAYYSYTYAPLYPGVPGCGVDPVYKWDYPAYVSGKADPWQIETMYPFINHLTEAGKAMSYVNLPDDVAAISDLYPTPGYMAAHGSIAGTLRLKDGKTDYSGINIVARNVNNLMGDAISAVSGDMTQGKVGPDGRFEIHNLTPGEQYVLYTEQIVAGGFSTPASNLLSVPEYWNAAESTDPATDNPCDATPILAQAGVTATADLYFNGYVKGVDFTPIGPFFLVDLAKNGASSLGIAGDTPFIWDQKKGLTVIGNATVTGGAMNRNGQKVVVETDLDGDGIQGTAIWTEAGGFTPLGHLGNLGCYGSVSGGKISSAGWAMSDDGKTVVGLAYWDKDGNGSCPQNRPNPEITGFVWTPATGMQELSIAGYGRTPSFIRAHGISGNGKVILGEDGSSRALAWVDGKLVDLYSAIGAREAYAASYDGTRVALNTNAGVVLWDYRQQGSAAFNNIGGLKWCVDLDYYRFGTNLCQVYDPNVIQQSLGPVPVLPTDMTDDGKIIIGRAGSFLTGFAGAIWMEPIGWMTWKNFFEKQGVVEATNVPLDNPISISASGSEVVGGIAGATYAWHINIDQVYVCEDGVSVQTGFPNGLFEKLAEGATFGRCAFADEQSLWNKRTGRTRGSHSSTPVQHHKRRELPGHGSDLGLRSEGSTR